MDEHERYTMKTFSESDIALEIFALQNKELIYKHAEVEHIIPASRTAEEEARIARVRLSMFHDPKYREAKYLAKEWAEAIYARGQNPQAKLPMNTDFLVKLVQELTGFDRPPEIRHAAQGLFGQDIGTIKPDQIVPLQGEVPRPVRNQMGHVIGQTRPYYNANGYPGHTPGNRPYGLGFTQGQMKPRDQFPHLELTLIGQPQIPFFPRLLYIEPEIARRLEIVDIQFGRDSLLLSCDSIPALMCSLWKLPEECVNVGQTIKIRLRNKSFDTFNVQCAMIGTSIE